jgi:hypothetical protein
MRRLVVAVFACAALAVTSAPASPPTYSGSVMLPTVTPAIARTLYQQTESNDHMTGDVFRIPGTADGKKYTLTVTSGATGRENPDAYFYTASPDGDYPGELCSIKAQDYGPASETGEMCPGDRERVAWAIVVLRDGARVTFDFSWAP